VCVQLGSLVGERTQVLHDPPIFGLEDRDHLMPDADALEGALVVRRVAAEF